MAQASLWTRPKLQEFITHVKRDANSVLVIGRGETVTIRVPTHENGSLQLICGFFGQQNFFFIFTLFMCALLNLQI